MTLLEWSHKSFKHWETILDNRIESISPLLLLHFLSSHEYLSHLPLELQLQLEAYEILRLSKSQEVM
jgi:hypothetical protein